MHLNLERGGQVDGALSHMQQARTYLGSPARLPVGEAPGRHSGGCGVAGSETHGREPDEPADRAVHC